jgi:hypothetical protein
MLLLTSVRARGRESVRQVGKYWWPEWDTGDDRRRRGYARGSTASSWNLLGCRGKWFSQILRGVLRACLFEIPCRLPLGTKISFSKIAARATSNLTFTDLFFLLNFRRCEWIACDPFFTAMFL